MARLRLVVRPTPKLTTTEWAVQRRFLSAKATAKPGRYKVERTPWVKGMHEALDDPEIFEIVCMKSAQVAWTDGVILNYVGKRIDIAPCPIIIMFPKEGAAKEFNDEKFTPMVESTPVLAAKIPVDKQRHKDNRGLFKNFTGGFLKFVSSNSPSSAKTTPAPVVIVEEPDDTNSNVKDQGDAVTILRERMKSYARRKMVFGGTPTVESLSKIQAAFKGSDQRHFYVPCPHCDEPQVLMWENVKWEDNAEDEHEILGRANLQSARYCCGHCGALWTDAEKNLAVRNAEAKGHGWRATQPYRGVAGFYINELYSPFPGSRMPELLRKYLTAQHHLAAEGDDTKMRSFRNNTEGLPYAYKSDVPASSDLMVRAEGYAELTVPEGGLILTAGVDVQHDRLAVVIRAWGRGEESWLVYWGEIFGSTLIAGQGAWADLDKLLTREFPHACGAVLKISAASIDGSDGNRTEIVREYVRKRLSRRYMEIKGASEQTNDKREIYSAPRRPDLNVKNKPMKRGVETHIVGTHRAKDLILENRVKQTGNGPGRMHWYASVRADYFEQLTSEVKVPGKINRTRKVWQKKGGARNEALDCEVYALHAARSVKTHLLQEAHWAALEERLRQRSLLDEASDDEPVERDEQDEEPQGEEGTAEAESVPVQASAAGPAAPPASPRPAAAPPPPAPKRKKARRGGRGGGFVNNF
jgi:phage terminase large subunit GpA-like protein